jgi:hypothetical protein
VCAPCCFAGQDQDPDIRKTQDSIQDKTNDKRPGKTRPIVLVHPFVHLQSNSKKIQGKARDGKARQGKSRQAQDQGDDGDTTIGRQEGHGMARLRLRQVMQSQGKIEEDKTRKTKITKKKGKRQKSKIGQERLASGLGIEA